MTTTKIAMGLAAILYLGYAALVLWTAPMLPERVASHFGFGGEPDGWMGKQQFLTFMLCFGLGLPLLITGLFALTPMLPRALINIPHKDHWLSPEQKETTRWWMINSGIWLSCLMLLLLVVTYWLVVQANRSQPVRLAEADTVITLSFFLLGMVVWVIQLVRRFSRRR